MGAGHFDSIRAFLSHEQLNAPLFKDLPAVPNLLVSHQRLEIKQLDDLLASISKGELTIGKEVVQITSFDGEKWRPAYNPDYRFWERGENPG